MTFVSKMIEILNTLISDERIIERCFVTFRIYYAWKWKDYSITKRLCEMIDEETREISIQNFLYLSEVSQILQTIFIF